MKFYQKKIFKIIMSIIAIIIVIQNSFLIFLAGVGIIVYLNKKSVKFKSVPKSGKVALSFLIIFCTLILIGVAKPKTNNKSVVSNSQTVTNPEATKSAEPSEIKEDTQSEQPTSTNDKTQSVDTSTISADSTKDNSTTTTDNSTKSSDSVSSNSTTNSTPVANSNDENIIVYYVPNSKVYHLSKTDSTLKKSKNILQMTLKEAKADGMHQSNSKADN